MIREISGEIKDGKLILYNTFPELAGIEISYSGNCYFTPTLPDNWVFQSSHRKIIIFNFGSSETIENGATIFRFEGTLNINYIMLATKSAKSIKISLNNYKQTWFSVGQIDSVHQNWEDIKSTNSNVRKNKKRLYPQHIQSQTQGTQKSPIKEKQYTKGGEYQLDGKDYKGWYHIHKDMKYVMTGKKHTKKSKLLQGMVESTQSTKVGISPVQIAQTTSGGY